MRYHVRAVLLPEQRANREADDLDEALAQAVGLARRGFKVWVYGHEHVVQVRRGHHIETRYLVGIEEPPLRWVAEFDPGGRRVR